jgi:transcriptional regulator with XRE-family HTH domain
VSSLDLFADELRRARSRAGMSQDQLAAEISYSSSLIAMVETSKRTPSRDFAERCDTALGTDGLLGRLLSAVNIDTAPEWFRPWLTIEREATTLRSFQPLLIPGLLQIQDYTRAVLSADPQFSEEEVDAATASRLERRQILIGSGPRLLIALIDEGALRRPVGGPKIMHDQLVELLDAAENPRIRLQIIPTEVGSHPGLVGAFVIASTEGTPDVLYLETVARGIMSGEPKDLAKAHGVFESLRSDALSRRQSLALIEEAARSWMT